MLLSDVSPPLREDPDSASLDAAPGVEPAAPCPPGPVLILTACPLCGESERTLVSEFNRFILLAHQPDESAAVYDYCLCHGCGVTYASKRPAGARYRWLLEHFEETLGRNAALRTPAKLTANTFALTDADKADLRRRAARGVFVSDHLGLSRKDYLQPLTADRLANGVHVEVLGSLLELRAPRVLEIRSRLGSIGASLRRLYGGEVYAVALFENQRYVIEQVYGITASALVDFERFTIPYEGEFDLVIANHMLTHAVHPREFLQTVRRSLRPGGHFYVYNEPDDAGYLREGKSMFGTLNAFHLQAFDPPSLTLALAANGFEVIFITRHTGHVLCLARPAQVARPTAIAPDALEERLELHRQARDIAILSLPEHARSRVAHEWPHAADRAVAAGRAVLRDDGQVRLRRRAPKDR